MEEYRRAIQAYKMTTLDPRGILESDIDAIIFSRSVSLPMGGVRDVSANHAPSSTRHAHRGQMACGQARPTSLTSSIQSLLSGQRASAFTAYNHDERADSRTSRHAPSTAVRHAPAAGFSTSPPTAFTALPATPQHCTQRTALRSFVTQAPVVKVTDHSHTVNGPCSPDSGRGSVEPAEEHIYESIEDDVDCDYRTLFTSASRRHLVPPPLPCRNVPLSASPAYVSPVRLRRNRPSHLIESSSSSVAGASRIRTNARVFRDHHQVAAVGEQHASTSALPQYHSIRDVRAHARLSMRDVSCVVDHAPSHSHPRQFEDTSSATDELWEDEQLNSYNQRASMCSLVQPRRRYLDELEQSANTTTSESKFNDVEYFADRFSDWSLASGRRYPSSAPSARSGAATSSKGGRQFQRANSQTSTSNSSISCVSATGVNEIEFDPKPWKPLPTQKTTSINSTSVHGTLC